MSTEQTPALFTAASLPERTGGRRTVADRVRSSVPDNTRRAYARWRVDYETWCAEVGVTAVPGTGETLAEWINHLLNRGARDPKGNPVEPWQPLSRSTIEQALAAIRTLHRAAGHPGQPDTALARQVIRGEGRERAITGTTVDEDQATPLLVPAIQKIIDTLDLGTHKGARDRALLLLGFAAMLRRSELAGLRIGDVTHTTDGLLLRLATSKTDHESTGASIPVPYGSHPDTCPVRAYDALVRHLAARSLDAPGLPLFRAVDRHGWARGPLRPADVSLIVQGGARAAGLPDPAGYSGHSMRAGAASASYKAGAPIEAIRRQGRWAPGSTALLSYFRAVDKWTDHPMRAVGL